MGKKHKGKAWSDGDENSRNKGRFEASQEDLSEYIHASRPGVIVVILSMLLLLTAVIVWGFVGTLPVTETVTGLAVDAAAYEKRGLIDTEQEPADPAEAQLFDMIHDKEGKVMVICFVDASRFNGQAIKEFGDKAVLKMPDQHRVEGTIETRYMVPISAEIAKAILFDNGWVAKKCIKQDYNWMLIIRPDEDLTRYAFTLSEVTLLTEEVHPIQFLLN